MKISIVGLGWLGMPLARHLRAGHEVTGTKSTAQGAADVLSKGVRAYQMQLNPRWDALPKHTHTLRSAEVWVLNVPPGLRSGQAPEVYEEGMKSVLEVLKGSTVKHLIFVSSTGVFGESQTEADEDTVPLPDRPAGKLLYRMEQLFQAEFAGQTTIIRPAGLVGPDRHPGRFLAGKLGLSGGRHPVNLVHLDDLISLTEAVILQRPVQSVFHAVAGQHPDKATYYRAAAEAMGLPRPTFDPTDSTSGKTIFGEKSKAQLAVNFKYDDPFQML